MHAFMTMQLVHYMNATRRFKPHCTSFQIKGLGFSDFAALESFSWSCLSELLRVHAAVWALSQSCWEFQDFKKKDVLLVVPQWGKFALLQQYARRVQCT